MNKYKLGSKTVDAIYSKQVLKLYLDNPLIEALPGIMKINEVYDSIQEIDIPSEEERNLSYVERKQGVNNLFYSFCPLAVHLELEQKISTAIRTGYIERNPSNPEYIRRLNQFSDSIELGNFNNISTICSNAPGFSIYGLSGVGKTTSVKKILGLYPQKIIHKEYKNHPFYFTQIVWMHLVCPYDGGVKGFCQEFFRAFDLITGDNTYDRYSAGRNTVDRMVPQMATLAQRHGLGLLVIDEIQNISIAKSGGIQKMLNFINQIINTIGVPVVLMGLPEAEEILSSNLMVARRTNGEQGNVKFYNHMKNQGEWDDFIDEIWKIQWTRTFTELTPEMSNILLEESGGITAMALILYSIIQKKAIMRGELEQDENERITEEVIREAVECEDYQKPRQQIARMKLAKERRNNDLDVRAFIWNEMRQEDRQVKQCLPGEKIEGDSNKLQESVVMPYNNTNNANNDPMKLNIINEKEDF